MWMRWGLITWFVVAIAITTQAPNLLSDSNDFLKNFVNHEFLNFMGVLVTITLASCANLFVSLHRLEAKFGKDTLKSTKKDVKDSSFFLIYLLLISLVTVIVKPLLPATDFVMCAVNSFAIGCVLMAAFALFDITDAAFEIAPLLGETHADNDQ
ncbi:hypothetical protein [Xanthobacter autotrophicus]|uniref:hypothetical protein n=1 Tax=Xanthobacter autotrophicus TaxID=280 RepID=UPI003729635C